MSARDDIRHKLVEESWYGRQVTDTPTTIHSLESAATIEPPASPEPALGDSATEAFRERWAVRPRDAASEVAPDHEHDFER